MAWQKGECGNPKGRPSVADPTVRLCREYAPKALEKIAELSSSEDQQVAYKAAVYLLERAYGKLKEHVELSGEVTHNLTAEEIRAELIKALVKK